MSSQRKGPKRVRAHIIGETAVTAFKSHRPQEWVLNDVKTDYGWDLLVTVTREEIVDEDFFVQMKGSEHPDYLETDMAISQVLKTSTVRWLSAKPMPIMVCICDTGKSTRPLYWVWLNESLKEIEKKNPTWLQQQNITIRVPTTQTMNESCKNQVETYVHDFYTRQNISKEIGEVIGPAFEAEKRQVREAYTSEPHEFRQQKIIPLLADAGIVEPTGEALSKEDQALFRKIKEAATALNKFQDSEAGMVIEELSSKIDAASEGMKARYFNIKGVLALHNNDLERALQLFKIAHEKRPKQVKYSTNLLFVEYELVRRDSSGQRKLSADWASHLESVLSKNPNFASALQLKAYSIGHLKGASFAESLLRDKPVWKEEPVPCSIALAELYMHEDNLERAINLLAEKENLGSKLDGIYWSVYGIALFRKSLNLTENESKTSIIQGPGPPEMDMICMEKTCECYAKAFCWFESRGMPRLAQPTVLNYSTTLELLGKQGESEQICKTYLRQYPDDYQVKHALAHSLFHQQKYVEAIPLMQDVYLVEPTSSTVFKNLMLCLFFAEEYEELLQLLKERQAIGFLNKKEEGLARSLAAIAFYELGQVKESQDQIEYLESENELAAEAAITKATVSVKSGVSKEESVNIIRSASQKHPNNTRLLSHLALNLAPATGENSAEVIECLRKVQKERQLIAEEFSLLGNALMILRKPEEAERVFRQASTRYQSEPHFLCDRAMALMEMGDAENAFNVLEDYIKQGQKSYLVLRNMAIIATDIDRLDAAINLFQMALGKTQDEKEIAEIHCQLYELKKRRRDDPKDILRHVVEYGKTTRTKPESEARYLAMFLTAPLIPNEPMDTEAKKWVKDFQNRLQKFSNKHPHHPTFMTLKLPSSASKEEMRKHLFAQIAGITLPHYLATVPLQLAVRNQPWPLAFRAQYLPSYQSIFEYWNHCISSKELGNAIHIFGNVNDINREFRIADKAQVVCIDINALFTLAQLELLDSLSNSFKRIIIARGTKLTIDANLFGPTPAHALAEKIEKWRLANRSKIRIRNANIDAKYNGYTSEKGNVIPSTKKDLSLHAQLTSGVGETLLLAQELQLPLYSDESIVRHWAEMAYQVLAFSTLAFIKKLVTQNAITESQYVAFTAKMIQMNFRTIQIEATHLNSRLKELLKEREKTDKLPKKDDFLYDNILGTLLKQFGDTTIDEPALVNLAVEWWVLALFDKDIPLAILPECIEYPSYALSSRSLTGVLNGVHANERNIRLATLWGTFLWRCYRKSEHFTRRAWEAVKSTCGRVIDNERQQEQTLFEFLPKSLGIIIEKDNSLNIVQKTSCIVKLPLCFEEHERIKFEDFYTKHKPGFLR